MQRVDLYSSILYSVYMCRSDTTRSLIIKDNELKPMSKIFPNCTWLNPTVHNKIIVNQ